MTKSLEKVFSLPPLKEALAEQENSSEECTDVAETNLAPTKILNALTVAEKIEHALTTVTELENNDAEMDEIAEHALESYAELKDLAMNMADAHSGRMMEVAANLLRTSLEAKEAKINRKLKTIDLQLKKMRLDRLSGKNQDDPTELGPALDRNELLRQLHIQPKEDK